jgi:hypothetical protein
MIEGDRYFENNFSHEVALQITVTLCGNHILKSFLA